MDLDEVLAAIFSLVGPHPTERQRRLLFGAAARALGHGGVSRVARLAEASRPTVRRGAVELDQPADPPGRIRQHQGHKRLRDRDPGLLEMLDRLVEPDTRGDPESPLRWTYKSTRELAQALTAAGHPLSDDTVGRLLKQQGYRLQRTVKTLEGTQHPDRDAGGSNGYRVRAWKTELARLAEETGLQVTVCHLPPGTSKGESNRAAAVQRDLDELAGPPAGKPPGDRGADRGDHHPDGSAGPCGARPRHLPAGGQGAR